MSGVNVLASRSNDQLMALHERHRGRQEMSAGIMDMVNTELETRLTGRQATRYRGDEFEVVLQPGRASYNASKLAELLEIIDEEDLIDTGAYERKTTKVTQVPVKWNATKLRPFLQLGARVQGIYEAARTPGKISVLIQRIEPKAAGS